MNIIFTPLAESHFSLLFKWLESPHVKKWWSFLSNCDGKAVGITSEPKGKDGEQNFTHPPDLVKEKYSDYVKGYKKINGINKPIKAYIICADNQPIGYIQLYNAYDFSRSKPLTGLPESLGSFDIFIGEEGYLGKGIGSQAIKIFTDEYVLPKYKYAFVDPEYTNERAVKAYEKAGFIIIQHVGSVFWMAKTKKNVRLSVSDSISLEVAFRKYFLKEDNLWLFGSRADLTRKGGDIDLYIETNAETIEDALKMKSNFIGNLEQQIGEQKIDVVLNMLKFPYPLPIHQVAKTEGVKIV